MASQECIKNSKDIQFGLNSGHFFAQMGSYFDCDSMNQNQNVSNYYIANFINNKTKANANLYMGLCLSYICTQEDVKIIVNKQLIDNQQTIKAILHYPLGLGELDLNPQFQQYSYSGWFYFTVILLSLLFILSIIAYLTQKLGKKKQKLNSTAKILQTFNIAESMKIFVYKQNYLNIFNGIKTLCMFWVIFGHQFSVRLKNDANIAGIPGQVQETFYLFVTGAFLAVDVFFFIGGFLVAYSFMRQKSKSVLKYPMAIVHRLLRFWPSYIVTILLYYSVYIHTGYGPLWGDNLTLGQIPYCQGAWKTLFFIDNIVDNGQKMCMGWGWYLQNDMQIFVVSLLFIFAYAKNRRLGYILLITMMIVGLSLNISQVVDRQIKQVTHLIDFVKWNQYFINIYIKPWIRCPPYILGLIFGLLHMEYLQVRRKLKQNLIDDYAASKNFFFRNRNKMQKNKWIVWLLQIFGLGFMLTTIVVPHDLQVGNQWPYWAHGVYLSFEKITFTFGVYLLILPTLLQIPNMAFFLLDTKFFNAISKISFWVYLIHFMIVEKMSYGQKVDFYYTLQTILPIYLAIAVLSLFFGFLGTIFVQVPFSKLQKMLFSVLMKKKQHPKKPISDSLAPNSSIISQIEKNSITKSLNESLITKQTSSIIIDKQS